MLTQVWHGEIMKSSLFRGLTTLIFLFVFAIGVYPQTTLSPPVTDIVERASAQTKAYIETFKNLLADETKTFEVYDKNGEVKKRRVVRSSFIVYQFTKDRERLNEYRNVVSVDGKPVGNADKRAQDFFEQIQNVESSQIELRKLQDESLRYDQDLAITGLTLFQSLALDQALRPYFAYKLEGEENLNEHPVFVVSYLQTRESPDIRVNAGDSRPPGRNAQDYDIDSDKDVPLNGRLRGRLWIDTQTFQVWKEHRELTVQPEGFDRPAAVIENEFEYQPSEFGILTPRLISHTQYRVRVKDRQVVKEAKVTFEYSKFSKPDVEVKSGEIKQP
jgi:hypothetical protein